MDKKRIRWVVEVRGYNLRKKIKENKFSLKQFPKINGGIVVMDPFTGRVLALVEVLVSKKWI